MDGLNLDGSSRIVTQPSKHEHISDRIIRPNCETHKTNWDGYAFYALDEGLGRCLYMMGGLRRSFESDRQLDRCCDEVLLRRQGK